MARRVATDYELLSAVVEQLHPTARAPARLVEAVSTLGDNTCSRANRSIPCRSLDHAAKSTWVPRLTTDRRSSRRSDNTSVSNVLALMHMQNVESWTTLPTFRTAAAAETEMTQTGDFLQDQRSID
jgi:hypothetical protein